MPGFIAFGGINLHYWHNDKNTNSYPLSRTPILIYTLYL
jgi:hypothetical protein